MLSSALKISLISLTAAISLSGLAFVVLALIGS